MAISVAKLKQLLEQAAEDAKLSAPDETISFRVSDEMPGGRDANPLTGDWDLLEQAVSNLLDNAAKYSYPHTTVNIAFGMRRGDHFFISVCNCGLLLTQEDAQRCTERGWRGNDAVLSTGEGSGIGLWISDHIMQAHGGQLAIVPTDRDGVTRFDLVFPVRCERLE